MKIVLFTQSLLSDWNHGNAHFLRGICSELLSQGNHVDVYEPAKSWSYQNLIRQEGEGSFQYFHRIYSGLNSIRYHHPNPAKFLQEANLAIVHEWNEPGLISALGEYRKRHPGSILLFHDTHHRSITQPDYFQTIDLDGYDGVLAYGESLSAKYREHHARVWTWHEAADIRVFQPLIYPGPKKKVVWVGNWGDGERTEELMRFLIRPVHRLGLETAVYGVRYPPSALKAIEAAGIEYQGWLPNCRVPETFARFQLTVHIPRKPYVEKLRGIPTIRPFEALACGIPLVSAPWDDVEELFEPGKDYLIARTEDEMVSSMSEVLSSPVLAKSLSRHGLRTILSRHTCLHRINELMRIVAEIKSKRPFIAYNGNRSTE